MLNPFVSKIYFPQASPNVDTLHTRMLMLHSQLDTMQIDPTTNLSSQTSQSSYISMTPPNKVTPIHLKSTQAADLNVNDDEIDSLYESIRNQQIHSVYVDPTTTTTPTTKSELQALRQENLTLKKALDTTKTKLQTMELSTNFLTNQVSDLEQQVTEYKTQSKKEVVVKQVVDRSNPPTPSQVIAIERKFQDQLEQERNLFQYKLIEMERVLKTKEYKTMQLEEQVALQQAEIQALTTKRKQSKAPQTTTKGSKVEVEAMQVHVHHLKSLFLQHVNGSSSDLVETVTSLSHKLSYWMVLRDVYEETVQELIHLSQLKDA